MSAVAVVLHFELEHPEQVADILTKIDPPSLPGFTGTANVVVEPHSQELRRWLDE